MGLNFSGLANVFSQVDAHIIANLIIDGKNYELEYFNIDFRQSTDFRGQPQQEVKGGQITVLMTQTVDDNIYDWAKRSTKRKDGKIVFSSGNGKVLEINFNNANCIKLSRQIDSFAGVKTTLTIAPEIVIMNGITHTNKWRNK